MTFRAILFKSSSENYQITLEKFGLQVTFVEALKFVFVNASLLGNKLGNLDYTGLILTSPRAIEAVSKCMDKTENIWKERKVYAVGESSGRDIKNLLNLSAIGLESGNSANLAEIIIRENPSDSKFLFPCGNLATPTITTKLKDNNIDVDSIVVYETVENENLGHDLSEAIRENTRLILVFFSPSGVNFVFNHLKCLNVDLNDVMIIAIGNTTSKSLEDVGLRVNGVANKPSAESLAEVINSLLENS